MKNFILYFIALVCTCTGCNSLQVASPASNAQGTTVDSENKVVDSIDPTAEAIEDKGAADLREAVKPDLHLDGGEIFAYDPNDKGLHFSKHPFIVVQAQFAKEEDDTLGVIYISRVEDWRTDTCFVVVSKYAYCDNELLRAGDYMYIGTDQYETYAKFKRTLRVFVDLDGMPTEGPEEDELQ